MKEHVGTDSIGNMYYRWIEDSHDGKEVERRSVRYKHGEYDPHSIPAEWWSWLHMSRKDPPSEELMRQLESMRQETRERAQALKKEEMLRKGSGDHRHQEHEDQEMERGLGSLLQDLGHREKIESGVTKETGEQSAWKPDAWKP